MAQVLKSQRINYREAADLYAYGFSTPESARMLGTSRTTIERAVKSLGGRLRSISDGKSLSCRGNRRVDSTYITVCVGKGKRVKEHRMIMESEIGRALTKNEVVHHINGNRIDNRIENLQLMTRSEHSSLHNEERKNHA